MEDTQSKAREEWVKELVIRDEMLNKNAFNLTSSDKGFLNYMKLKDSFHVEALNMVDWIKKEITKDHGILEDYIYFMDNGFRDNKPNRYKYRTAVFNDIKKAIQNDEPFNIYDVVYKWDMWYHS